MNKTALTLLAPLLVSGASLAEPGTTAKAGVAACCAVVELRQYTMYPGRRDELISLFESKLLDTQEDVAMQVPGQFRDLNDANRFVWVRGFQDMEQRKKALTDFYYGPVWAAHRAQANPTLFDNDNVLLLRPASPGSGFTVDPRTRAAPGVQPAPGNFTVATLYYFDQEVSAAFVDRFDKELLPLFQQSGARVLARFVSEKSKNTFERLPVREKENVFVWFASFADRRAYDRYIDTLAQDARWRDVLFAKLHKSLQRPPEILMLESTPRSAIR